MTIEKSCEWLVLLEAELARRAARVQWKADEGDRQRAWFAAELQGMAQRLAAAVDKHPLDLADMSPAEMLAVHWFWPKPMRPAGLPSEAAIWAQFRARTQTRSGEP